MWLVAFRPFQAHIPSILCLYSLTYYSIAPLTWLGGSTGVIPFTVLPTISNLPNTGASPSLYDFFTIHANLWQENSAKFSNSRSHPHVSLQYFIRSFFPGEMPGRQAYDGQDTSGINCERDHGTLLFEGRMAKFTECRYSLALSLSPTPESRGAFTLLLLEDHEKFRYKDNAYFTTNEQGLDGFGLEDCHSLTGVAEFQRLICIMTGWWAKNWQSTLMEIDGIHTVKVLIYPFIAIFFCKLFHDS
jgi:hypothetical protein